ncbi:MAG: chemotaxis protein CheX [Bdellovibrionota bacterium]
MKNKKLLVFSDDAPTLARLQESLNPVHDKTTYASQINDAIFKAQNSQFDAILMRTQKPTLKDHQGFFSWCQSQKNYRRIPFIVVGEDIEDKNILVTQDQIRFLPTGWKTAQLFDILDGIFFEGSDAAKNMVSAKFVNPIVGAVVDVIGTMSQIQLERGPPSVLDKDSAKTRGDVTGMISVNSENFSGSLAIVFKQKLILSIYKNMMSEEKTLIDDDVKDCVMEITNIVFGNARRDLNLIGHSIKPARPTVISGTDHEVTHSSQGFCLHLPFKAVQGEMIVELLVTMLPKKS